jgi:hypothetical protein
VEEEDGDEQENKVTAREPTRRDRQVMQQRRVGSFGTEAMDWESAAGGKQLGASVWWDAPAVKRTSQRMLGARGGGDQDKNKTYGDSMPEQILAPIAVRISCFTDRGHRSVLDETSIAASRVGAEVCGNSPSNPR